MKSFRISIPEKIREIVAGAGFVLMVASFVWWQSSLGPSETISTHLTPPPAVFSLVVLDPGHGGQDSGAICAGVQEKDLTLDIAQRIDRLLQAQGVASLLTRTGDSYVSLADRAAVTNRSPDCIFVSIHFNEGNKNASAGVETYYAERQMSDRPQLASWLPFLQRAAFEPTSNVESESLAGFIQEALVARTQAMDRGTKPGNFYVIANVHHPAVLVEGGFLSNKDDIAKLATWDYREQMAVAITDGILRYREALKQRDAVAGTNAPAGSE